MNSERYVVDEEYEGLRLDQYLSDMLENISRSYLQKLIKEERVLVNGSTSKNRYLVKDGDIIILDFPAPRVLSTTAEKIPLEIVFEDDALLVVNKPQNMVVHPGAGNENGTLVNALLYHCQAELSTINGVFRPGIVHRIDKDTSGLLVVAKNDAAHQGLAAQLADHSMQRVYEAVAIGRITDERIKIDAPIGRHPQQRFKMTVDARGRSAVTHIAVKERFLQHTYLEARLETGRTHQIRVHMSYIQHPILGDERYGGQQKKFNVAGQVLHAKTLGFIHPITKEKMFFEAPLPESFRRVLKILQ